MTHWTNILDNMNGKLSPESLRDVFYRKIKDVEALRQDMNRYERFREHDPNKTYEWLMQILQQEIRLRRQNRNTAEREILMSKSNGIVAKAKAAVVKEETKTPPVQTAEQKEADKQANAMKQQLANLTKELALVTINKGDPKGKGKGKQGDGKSRANIPCYHFSISTCIREGDCFFSHAQLSKE